MFLSFSKTLAKFGGFRIGAGMRLTKKNSMWMLFILMFVYILQATWYMMLLCGWLLYAMIYGMVYVVKKIVNPKTKTD